MCALEDPPCEYMCIHMDDLQVCIHVYSLGGSTTMNILAQS